jgi:hypothetical protein
MPGRSRPGPTLALTTGRERRVDLIAVSAAGQAEIIVAGSVYAGLPSVAGEIANRTRWLHGPAVYPAAALRALAGWTPAGVPGGGPRSRCRGRSACSCRPEVSSVSSGHPVGVPFPVAIAKMCMAVTPFPTPLLTVGSVTDATVLPACSGTDAKYTLTGCGVCVLLEKFQLDVVVAMWSPETGALLYQSAMARLNDWVLPSV